MWVREKDVEGSRYRWRVGLKKVPPVKTVHKTRMGSIIVPGFKEE